MRIATFTSDLIDAVREADDRTKARVAAIDERNVVRAYRNEVRWRIRQGKPESYVAAAQAINASNADVVCIQHEFGLYGLWRDESWEEDRWIEGNYVDHLTPMSRVRSRRTGPRDAPHRAARTVARRA